MTIHIPISMQPTVGDATYPAGIPYTAQEFRQMFRSILNLIPGGLNAEGVCASTDFAATQRAAGANFSIDVAAGYAWTNGNDISWQGPYFVWSDAVTNVSTFSGGGGITAPGSGTRIHRLVLQVEDKLTNGTWTGYTANLLLLQDTGAGTPAEPNSADTIALVSIAAGQASILNANITDQRTNLSGGATAPDSWHALTLVSGWTNAGGGGATAKYRFMPGNADRVEVVGEMTSGTIANGTALNTAVPANYRPVSSQSLLAMVTTGAGGVAGTGDDHRFLISASGVITMFNLGANTGNVAINGSYSLSA